MPKTRPNLDPSSHRSIRAKCRFQSTTLFSFSTRRVVYTPLGKLLRTSAGERFSFLVTTHPFRYRNAALDAMSLRDRALKLTARANARKSESPILASATSRTHLSKSSDFGSARNEAVAKRVARSPRRLDRTSGDSVCVRD